MNQVNEIPKNLEVNIVGGKLSISISNLPEDISNKLKEGGTFKYNALLNTIQISY